MMAAQNPDRKTDKNGTRIYTDRMSIFRRRKMLIHVAQRMCEKTESENEPDLMPLEDVHSRLFPDLSDRVCPLLLIPNLRRTDWDPPS
jgi:hypothetical protein